jgi:hypothetical protein
MMIRGGDRGGYMGDGPILKLTSKLNLNLVLHKSVNTREGCWYHRCPDHDPSLTQFNFKLQLVSDGGCW